MPTDPTEAEIEAALDAYGPRTNWRALSEPAPSYMRDSMRDAILAVDKVREARAPSPSADPAIDTILAAIREASARATQGEWTRPGWNTDVWVDTSPERTRVASACTPEDAAHIAACSPANMAKLLAHLDDLTEMNRVYAENNPKGYAAANRERERAEKAERERDEARESQAWQDACATVAFREREALRAEIARLREALTRIAMLAPFRNESTIWCNMARAALASAPAAVEPLHILACPKCGSTELRRDATARAQNGEWVLVSGEELDLGPFVWCAACDEEFQPGEIDEIPTHRAKKDASHE